MAFLPHPERRPVLVAGASSGIGAATARWFAEAGYPVALAARHIDVLESLAAELRAGGAEAVAVPLDVTDEDVVGWMCTSASSDSADDLRDELRLAASLPRVPLAGDVVDLLPIAVERVPAGALPVIMTTWSLSRLKPARRLRVWERLRESAGTRPMVWVSVEGVGIAPHVPTLGDRPASGHSIIGLGLYDGSAWSVEALGRCWSRGRMIEWVVGRTDHDEAFHQPPSWV